MQIRHLVCFCAGIIVTSQASGLAQSRSATLKVLGEANDYQFGNCFHLINGGSIRTIYEKKDSPTIRVNFDPPESGKVEEDTITVFVGTMRKGNFTKRHIRGLQSIRKLVEDVYMRQKKKELSAPQGLKLTRIEELAVDDLLRKLEGMISQKPRVKGKAGDTD